MLMIRINKKSGDLGCYLIHCDISHQKIIVACASYSL